MTARRKYSLEEIDRMRAALFQILGYPIAPAVVEDRLRTLMFNGTDPSELDAPAAEAERRSIEQHEAWMEEHRSKMAEART